MTIEDPLMIKASLTVGIDNPKLQTRAYFDRNEVRRVDLNEELLIDTLVGHMIEPLEEQLRKLVAMEITMIRQNGVENTSEHYEN